MKKMLKLCYKFIWLSVYLKNIVNSFSLTPRTIALDSFSACPQDEKNAIHFDGVIKKTTRNKYSVNGEFEFTDNAMGPIELLITATRCDFNLTQCDKKETINVRDICKLLSNQKQIWSDLMSHLQPRLMCPFNYTSIQVINATVDLSFISHLPIDGYSWLTYLNLFENNGDNQKGKKKVFCITCKTTITKTHRNRGK